MKMRIPVSFLCLLLLVVPARAELSATPSGNGSYAVPAPSGAASSSGATVAPAGQTAPSPQAGLPQPGSGRTYPGAPPAPAQAGPLPLQPGSPAPAPSLPQGGDSYFPQNGTLQKPAPADAAGLVPGAPGVLGASEQVTRELPQAALPPQAESPDDVSAVEKVMSAEDDGGMKPQPFSTGKLTQFGYSFFKPSTSFSPAVDFPVGPDYLIGPGDTLIVTTWGSLDATLPLEVNRSGEITLPRVGALKVWGTSFGRVPEAVRAALSQTFKNVKVNVTMGKLRLIKVYVVGEVNAPGAYDISALSTVINALSAAGGPSKQGTLRSIQVLRGGKVVETVDLYDFFLKGDKSRDIRLQPGDTINVPVHGKLVGIAGDVRKQGIYEFSDGLSLRELLEMAGGVSSSGYLQRVQIARMHPYEKKVVADFNLEAKLPGQTLDGQSAQVKLQDMDLVKIFPIDRTVRDHVQLQGYVLRPGSYALKPGMRLSDLVTRENLLPDYYPQIAEITRMIPPHLHQEKMHVKLDEALAGDPQENILLNEFDVVRVYSRFEMEEIPTARISGDVQKPGIYRLFNRMTLRDLVYASGNVKSTAFLKSAEVTRTVISREGVRAEIIDVDLGAALQGDPRHNIALENFDEVVIRRVPEWKEETDRYVTLTGEVRFPGTYPIIRGEKLSSVIARAGGFTDKAYFRAAKFTRKLTRELQQKRMDEVITRTDQELTRKQQELASVAASKEELEATKVTIEAMRANLEKLKQAKAEGRISITLLPLEQLAGSLNDVVLQGGDALDVPQSSNSIMTFGEVYNPTTVLEQPGETVAYYLKKAGGPTSSAEEGGIYVVRADGTVVSKREKKGFFYNSFMSMPLEAGDTIVVPQQLEKVAWMRDLKDIAFIIGQTALAAGVLVAAGL